MYLFLSKGLSCPIGSLIVGREDIINKARKYRKMLGGGWRQAGIIASMVLVALEEKCISRLKEDHDNAKLLASGIKAIRASIKIQTPQTNIIFAECNSDLDSKKVVSKLNKEGIKCLFIGDRIRLVTHYGINKEDIEYTIEIFKKVLQSC